MSDEAASKFMSSVIEMIFLADATATAKVFKPGEAQRLKDEAVRLRQSAAKIFFGIERLINTAPINDQASANPFSELDHNLQQMLISAYRIGAATWLHNANERAINTIHRPKKMRDANPDALSEQERKHRHQALQFALAKPLSKPLGKARGTTAYARRLLPAFNAHLKELGADPVSQDVIEKMLRKSPPPKSQQE